MPSNLHDSLTCMAKLGDPEKGRKTIIQKKVMNTITMLQHRSKILLIKSVHNIAVRKAEMKF